MIRERDTMSHSHTRHTREGVIQTKRTAEITNKETTVSTITTNMNNMEMNDRALIMVGHLKEAKLMVCMEDKDISTTNGRGHKEEVGELNGRGEATDTNIIISSSLNTRGLGFGVWGLGFGVW